MNGWTRKPSGGQLKAHAAKLSEIENRVDGIVLLLDNIAVAASDPFRLTSGDFAGAVQIAHTWVASIAADIKTMQEEE